MATITIPIQVRQDTFANWTANNPIVRSGEWAYETDYFRLKIGRGIAYNDTPYFTSGGGSEGAEYFPNEAALLAAYPTGTTGQFALVSGATNVTIWAWDPVAEEWVDTGNIVNFVIDDALDPLSDNAVKNKRIVEEFAKYLKTDGTISIDQVTTLTTQLLTKLEESDIYGIISPMLQQGFGIAIQKTGGEFRFINTNPETGTAANWGSVGGAIGDQADLQALFANKLGFRTGINKPWAASIALDGGAEPNEVFDTDATGDFAVTLATTRTGYVLYQYIIKLTGISSLQLSLPATVKDHRERDIVGNVVTIEGEPGDAITIWFEKRGSNWSLWQEEEPTEAGATTLNDLTDVNAPTPSNNDVLTWDDTEGEWVASPPAGTGETNLTATQNPTTVVITSDTGTDATIVAVDGTNAGVMLPAQKTKLDGIATGATANDTDANLKNRANHTGTQDIATITGGGVQDLYIPTHAMWERFTNGCSSLQTTEIATSLLNIQSLDFDPTTQEFAQFMIAMPRNWNNGTIKAKFYWTAASGSGGVVWAMSGAAYSNDDPLSGTLGTEQVIADTLIAANDMHVTDYTPDITIGGSPADSDYIVFQVSRNPANASDTLAVDARLLGLAIRLTLDSLVAE